MKKLTNRDISENHREGEHYFNRSDFLAAFAYWVVAQNPNKKLIDINPSLRAFKEHVESFFENNHLPEKFTYNRLRDVINDDVFENIPEILELNELKPDFIDLGALARNIFFMLLRESITQS